LADKSPSDKPADKPPADKPAARADADAKALRGTWQQADGDRYWRWEFTDDDHLIEMNGPRRVVTGRSAVKLDATKSPRHISWDGGVGIYHLKGDTLTVCFTAGKNDDKDRPKAFADENGKYQLLKFTGRSRGEKPATHTGPYSVGSRRTAWSGERRLQARPLVEHNGRPRHLVPSAARVRS
jgi:uncharacterized protein (TIGR03067 family)